MRFQTVLDPTTAEKAFRVARNGYTATLTATAATIANGSPVVLATHTDSNNGYDIQRPATSTSIVNNLYIGNAHYFPELATNTAGVWQAEQAGVVQCYGYDDDAQIQVKTAAQSVGSVLIPESLQFLVSVSGPVTAAATSTAAHTEVPALGGLAVLMEAVASSSATDTGTAKVFLRCM